MSIIAMGIGAIGTSALFAGCDYISLDRAMKRSDFPQNDLQQHQDGHSRFVCASRRDNDYLR